MTAPSTAPPAASEISLVEAVWRYRLMSSLIVVACVLASVAATAFFLGGATATARFAVTDPTNNNNVLRQGVVSGPGYAAYTAQRAAFAGSAPVLGRAAEIIKSKHGPALTAASLRGRVKTSTKPDSGVVIVNASGGDMPQAALIANAVVQAYQEETIATATAKLDNQLKKIQDSEREITRNLETTPASTREGRVLAANLAKLQSQESGVLSARANANDGVQFVDNADPRASTPDQMPQNAVIGLAIGAILACVVSFLRATSGGPLRRVGSRSPRPSGPERRIERIWTDEEVYGAAPRPALPPGNTGPNRIIQDPRQAADQRYSGPAPRQSTPPNPASPSYSPSHSRPVDPAPRADFGARPGASGVNGTVSGSVNGPANGAAGGPANGAAGGSVNGTAGGSGFGASGSGERRAQPASEPDGRRVAGGTSTGGRHSANRPAAAPRPSDPLGADVRPSDPLGVDVRPSDPLGTDSRSSDPLIGPRTSSDSATGAGTAPGTGTGTGSSFGRAPELGVSPASPAPAAAAPAAAGTPKSTVGEDGPPVASGRGQGGANGRARSGGAHSRGSSRDDGSFRDPAKALETGLSMTPPQPGDEGDGAGETEAKPADLAGDPGRTVEDLRIVDDEMLAAAGKSGKPSNGTSSKGSVKGAANGSSDGTKGTKGADGEDKKDVAGNGAGILSGDSPLTRFDRD
ncbi:hypothetical protein [Actinomadura gamaensis]|uniref:Capsular polysaccharide biosynthesis protein n=1 Tax=Actinomadura gamaensis TaxID=1763541 RepID=A0ABV9U3R7_9ACTN